MPADEVRCLQRNLSPPAAEGSPPCAALLAECQLPQCRGLNPHSSSAVLKTSWLKLPLACLADAAADTDSESEEDDVEDVDEGEQRQEPCAAERTGLLPLF